MPELAAEYVGKVRLAYLDPPFNTQQAFAQYDDALEHSVWLTMMRDRLVQVKRLLSPAGSVWLHLDDAEMAYGKALLDEVFGRENFVATVVWQRQYTQSNIAVFSTSHDYILIYALDRRVFAKTRNLLPRTAAQDARYSNPDGDPKGPWKAKPLQARNPYSKGLYPVTTRTGRVIPGPPDGTYWRIAEEKLKELDAEGEVYWGKGGDGVPVLKTYLAEVSGVVPKTWWSHEEAGHTDEAKTESKRLNPGQWPFDTPKPERLLRRIIAIATDPGDIVLDCFLGSGTTAAVAHKMGRRWVGIERSAQTVETFCLPRLKRVVEGADDGGVTKETEWKGGGGLRVLDVAPSMFEDDEGTIVIAEWATKNRLAEATAAQFGYEYEPDPPFAGRKGRFRIAVIDGNVSADVVKLLAGALGQGERLVVCGTSLDPDAPEALRRLRPGSEARKVPAAILADYHLAYRWQAQPALPDAEPVGAESNSSEPNAETSEEVPA